jgi:hypothetical protein
MDLSIQKQKQEAVVCDECLTAASDEGCRTKEEQMTICTAFGSEIHDHICLKREGDQDRCDCLCNSAE